MQDQAQATEVAEQTAQAQIERIRSRMPAAYVPSEWDRYHGASIDRQVAAEDLAATSGGVTVRARSSCDGRGRPGTRRVRTTSASSPPGESDDPEPGESRRSNAALPLAVNRRLAESVARIGVVA